MAEDNDFEKVQAFIKEQVDTYAPDALRKATPQQPQVDTDAQAKRQFGELIDPFVSPHLAKAQFTADDAKDYVDFYGDEGAREYKDQVEDLFQQAAKNNRPMPRKEILRYVRGKEYEADPEAFVTKASEKKKAQLERAEAASDFGAFSTTRAKADPTFGNFEKLSLDEMEKALEGISF